MSTSLYSKTGSALELFIQGHMFAVIDRTSWITSMLASFPGLTMSLVFDQLHYARSGEGLGTKLLLYRITDTQLLKCEQGNT